MDRSDVPENIIYYSTFKTEKIEIKINDSALEGIIKAFETGLVVWVCEYTRQRFSPTFLNDVCTAVSLTHTAIISMFPHSAIQLQNIF